ncbi:MAG: hypothetical protein JOZ07_16105 [Solirubrobacterales bacterium]|nr:hypothetical protein [Solirubrobacterales bacterium]
MTAIAPRPAGRSVLAPPPTWLHRLAPTLVAAVFAAAYVIVKPPSLDLADHLFRAQLFRDEGFGLWNNLWYSGHHIVSYSILFPAASALLTPQLAGALAATATAAVFEPLARRHFGSRATLGALLFGAATAIDLYTGRLAFAFGVLPALGAIVCLDRDWRAAACGLAVLSALCSPVAALFAGLAAAGLAAGDLVARRRLIAAIPGATVAVAALLPVASLSIAFPEGGVEPFGLATMLPLLVAVGLMLCTLPPAAARLRAGLLVYAAALVVVYLVPSPIGGTAARLGAFLAAPVAALLWWGRRPRLLALAILPLLYLGWAAPVRDVVSASGDPSASAAYYQPLLRFLRRASVDAAPFRTEIPFTRFHWEAWVVASHFAIARGWERQLDVADNPIFYSGHLTAASYEGWLHDNAIRFVAAPDAPLDYSAQAEEALIDHGLPYLQLVMRSRHWRVYRVLDAEPIATGVARLIRLGPDTVTLRARSAGSVLLHVRFTPYWALARGSGCVGPAGPYTRLTLRRAGPVVLVARFALGRIGATSPRCD